MERGDTGNLLETVLTAYNRRCNTVTEPNENLPNQNRDVSYGMGLKEPNQESADELSELKSPSKRVAPTKPRRKASASRASSSLLADLDLGEPLDIQNIMDTVKAKNEDSSDYIRSNGLNSSTVERFNSSTADPRVNPTPAVSYEPDIAMHRSMSYNSCENLASDDAVSVNLSDIISVDDSSKVDALYRPNDGSFSRVRNCSYENLAGGSDTGESVELNSRMKASASVQSDLNYVGLDASPMKKRDRFGSRRKREKKKGGDKEFGQFLDSATSNASSAYAKFRQFKKSKLKDIRAKKDEILDGIPRKPSFSKAGGGEDKGGSLMRNDGEKTMKSGWLKKQGGMMKSWNDRWFIMTESSLYYYKDKDENKLLGVIPLGDNQLEENPLRPYDGTKFLFGITAGTGTKNQVISHTLSASSKTDKDEWIRMIKKVLNKTTEAKVFGQELRQVVMEERKIEEHTSGSESFRTVPVIVEKCCDFIRENNGYMEEGLFRLPGQANDVQDLRDAFDNGEWPNFDRHTDIHTVTSLLKSYLRELPEPIVPFRLYSSFIDAAKSVNPGKQTIKRISTSSLSELEDRTILDAREEIRTHLEKLPEENFNLLGYLCRFLDEVQQYSESNKMDTANLALVFGPNIIRAEKADPMTMMSHSTYVQYVMSEFITNQRYFFGEGDVSDRGTLTRSYDENNFSTSVHDFYNESHSHTSSQENSNSASAVPHRPTSKSAVLKSDPVKTHVDSGNKPYIPPKPRKVSISRMAEDKPTYDNVRTSPTAKQNGVIRPSSHPPTLSNSKSPTRNSVGDILHIKGEDTGFQSPKHSDSQESGPERHPHPPARKKRTKPSEYARYGTVPRANTTDGDEVLHSDAFGDKTTSNSRPRSGGSVLSSDGSVLSNDSSSRPRQRHGSTSAPAKRPTTRPPPPPQQAGSQERRNESGQQQTYQELQEENKMLKEKLLNQRFELESRIQSIEENVLNQIRELRNSFTVDVDVEYAVVSRGRRSTEFPSDKEVIQHLRESVLEERRLRQIAEIKMNNEKRNRISTEERNVHLQKKLREVHASLGSENSSPRST